MSDNPPKQKSIFNWSGGKDSALALYHCLQNPDIDIQYLVTTVNDAVDRISMHGVRTELLIKQAESIGIPLYQIRLPEMPGMEAYDHIMRGHLEHFRNEGITHSIFGDIFLEDLKQYRDNRLAEVGMTGIYPLWQRDTRELINEFLSLGFGTVIACTQERLRRIVGKEITDELITSLPGMWMFAERMVSFTRLLLKARYSKMRSNIKQGRRYLKNIKRRKTPMMPAFLMPQKSFQDFGIAILSRNSFR